MTGLRGALRRNHEQGENGGGETPSVVRGGACWMSVASWENEGPPKALSVALSMASRACSASCCRRTSNLFPSSFMAPVKLVMLGSQLACRHGGARALGAGAMGLLERRVSGG